MGASGTRKREEGGFGGGRGRYPEFMRGDVLDFTTGWRRAEGICRLSDRDRDVAA